MQEMEQGHLGARCPRCGYTFAQMPERCQACGGALVLLEGRYWLLDSFAEGGFGVLFHGLEQSTGRRVAIKALRRQRSISLASRAKSRFLREIDAVQVLSPLSEHIATYLHHGEDLHLGPYFVMEYLEGQTLQALIAEHGTVPLGGTLHILKQLCHTLSLIHEQGYIHRDIKPSNIFLVERGDDPYYAKLIDFGLTKLLYSVEGTPLTTDMLGSPQYISPEQVLNEEIEPSTDVYALALVGYELLTGEIATQGQELEVVVQAQLFDMPRSLSEVCPYRSFPQGLEEILFRALHKEPVERYSDAQSFWAALAPYAVRFPWRR